MFNKQEQKKLIITYILWLIPVVFSSVWLIYFKENGLSDLDISLAYLFWPLAIILSIFLFGLMPAFDKRVLIAGGALAGFFSYLILLFFQPSFFLLAASFFIYGFSVYLFWVPFNIMYFRDAAKNAATSSTVYFSISGLLSILLTVIGGLVLQQLGSFLFFLISAILFLPVIASAFLLKKEEHKNELLNSLNETRGFRTLNFLEGTTTGVLIGGTLVSLSLLHQPFYLSLFIAFVTIFSILASFLVCRISDRNRKRKFYLEIFSIFTALSTIAMFFFSDVISWAILSSIRNFFAALFWPFTTALLVDNKRKLSFLMVGRELFLNLGRILGISAVALSVFLFSDVRISFVFLGAILLLYPLVLSLKRHKITIL